MRMEHVGVISFLQIMIRECNVVLKIYRYYSRGILSELGDC